MASKNQKASKKAGLLVTVAESIGGTLGTIAAKASAVPDAVLHSSLAKKAARQGNKVVRKSKALATRAVPHSTKRKARPSRRVTRKRASRATAVKKRIADVRRTEP